MEVPKGHLCCGRPLYDYGFLDLAKQYLRKIFDVLAPHAAAGTPIVILEPSCWSVFRDEMRSLFPNRKETELIKKNSFLPSEFLVEKAQFHPPRLNRSAIVHGHCHHKSIIKGAEHEKKLLEEMQMKVRVLSDTCCGMAGSFGFEEDHYDKSAKVGEHGLPPAVRKAGLDEVIVADGFSCREQISKMPIATVCTLPKFCNSRFTPARRDRTSIPPKRSSSSSISERFRTQKCRRSRCWVVRPRSLLE